jgi:hypothetical protein
LRLSGEECGFEDNVTIPAGYTAVDGRYQSEEEGRRVLQTTLGFLRYFGAFLNLEGLEAITIADDYAGAAANVERGFETFQALTPTNDEFGTGLAMAVPVIRAGCLKTHIVLDSRIPRALNPDWRAAHPKLFGCSLPPVPRVPHPSFARVGVKDVGTVTAELNCIANAPSRPDPQNPSNLEYDLEKAGWPGIHNHSFRYGYRSRRTLAIRSKLFPVG